MASQRARRGLTAAALLTAGGLLLAACTSGTTPQPAGTGADGAPQSGGTLIVGQYQEVTNFNPTRQYSWETWRIDRNIYETLVDEDLSSTDGVPEIIPKLATSWDISDDATTFTFHLREGVEFTDGTPFNAEAVEFNVRTFTDPDFEYYDEVAAGTMALVYGNLESFTVIDEYTVEYTFKSPYLEFLRQIPNSGNAASGIFSPTAFKELGPEGLGDNPVGTGPFVFVERVRGERTVLERNDDYWGEKALLDRVIFRPIQNDQSRVAALQTGEVDLISRVPADSVSTLEADGFAVPEQDNVPQIIYYQFNWDNEYVRDKRIREALIHAIDREGLAEQIYQGYANPAYSILNQGNEAHDPDVIDYEYDPELAKELIADAGYESGEITINLITDAAGQPTAEWIQQNLQAVGINVTLESYEWIAYGTRSQNLEPADALRLGEWGYVTPDWLRIAYQFYTAPNGGEQYTSQETLDAIAAASANGDPDKRVELWQAADEAWRADATIIPLTSFNRYYALSPKVQGFVWPQQNHYDLSKVWLSE